MSNSRSRLTVGFLSTWSVYQGATIDGYTYTLLQGISAAARERDCNLLLGCGISLAAGPRTSRTAWSVAETDADFVPVGPWNADGLIVIPDDLSDSQFAYLKDLAHAGYPIVMTTAEIPGLVLNNSRLVTVDNAGGIRHAMQHLFLHGHRQIAFVAGKSGHGGDSAERLAAYRGSLREANIPYDPRLVAFGEHRTREGRAAMQQILDTGALFTALVASNDLSCLGAIEVLRAAGRRVPEDIAVIGFDDILEARSQLSPLTTVRHPTFALGYQSVVTLLTTSQMESLESAPGVLDTPQRIPTQLVVRQSCGCRPESATSKIALVSEGEAQTLVQAMAQATVVEARHSTLQEIEPVCLEIVRAFETAIAEQQAAPFDHVLQHLTAWLNTHQEDAYAWHAAISNLRALLKHPATGQSPEASFPHTLIDRARLEIAELAQRQATDVLVQHMEISNRLGLMTAQLLAVLDTAEGAAILAEHLPHLGIEHALVAMYYPRDDDPYGCARVLIDTGTAARTSRVGLEFSPRDFPPDDFYPDLPLQLVLLPLALTQPHSPALSAPGRGGIQVRYNNRPVVPARSTEAMTLVNLGSGSNGIGYYMFHGGTTPRGKDGFRNERLHPQLSYDFQAPLGEYGQEREIYRSLKLLHLFLETYGEQLAPMQTVLPQAAAFLTPANLTEPRFCARGDGLAGFLFVNNFQDHLTTRDIENVSFVLENALDSITLPPLTIPHDACFILPFGASIAGARLRDATAQPLTRVQAPDYVQYFYFAPEGITPEFCFDAQTLKNVQGEIEKCETRDNQWFIQPSLGHEKSFTFTTARDANVRITTLTRAEAEHAWKGIAWGGERVIVCTAPLTFENDAVTIMPLDRSDVELAAFPPLTTRVHTDDARVRTETFAHWTRFQITFPARHIALDIRRVNEGKYEIQFPSDAWNDVHDIFLRVDYEGDTALAFLDGVLIADNFCNGLVWEIGLKQFAPRVLEQGLVLVFRPVRRGALKNVSSQNAARFEFDGDEKLLVHSITALPEYRARLSSDTKEQA